LIARAISSNTDNLGRRSDVGLIRLSLGLERNICSHQYTLLPAPRVGLCLVSYSGVPEKSNTDL